jgi:predicted DNA binding CopG/RHH family protein
MTEKPRAVLKKPFSKSHLNHQETELSGSFTKDNWKTVTDMNELSNLETAVRLAKSERTNIRLSEVDLAGIKEKAREKGLGYQTLIQSLIHQYVAGTLVEYSSAVSRVTRQALVDVAMELGQSAKQKQKKSRGSQSSVSRRKAGKLSKHAHR